MFWPPKCCREHWCCLQNGYLENPAQTCTRQCSRDSWTGLTYLVLCFCRQFSMHTWDTCASPYRDENPVCCSCTVLYVGSRGAEPQQQAAAGWRGNHLIQGGSRANQRKWASIARERSTYCTEGADKVPVVVTTDFVGGREDGKRQKQQV